MTTGKADDQKAHATFGASNSKRWMECPGSIALCERAPPQPDSPYAEEGTKAHACLEFLLKNRGKLDRALKTARKTFGVDMIEHATAVVHWVEAELEKRPSADFYSEVKVDSSSFTCTGQFGTLDIAIAEEWGELTVVDYKYGAGIAVDPEGDDGLGNSQLVYYALALGQRYEHNFSTVRLVVIQPRAFHASGEVIREVTFPVDEILKWQKRFRDAVMECGDKKAPLKAGSWCRFCQAGPICPELKQEGLRKAQVVFSDETGIESMPEPTMVKLPHLGTILEGCERLEAWIEKVREHAAHVLTQGGDVAGWKLVQKRAQRRWKDEAAAAQAARAAFGAKAFTEPALLSPAQLEKKLKAPDWVAARTTAESSGTTLARASDKRPAVEPIQKVFAK